MRSIWVSVLLACLLSQPLLATPPRPLAEALLELQSAGLDLFFTNQLVRPDMRVLEEPTEVDPRRRLDALLEPHGLAATDGPGGKLVIVEAEPKPSGVYGVVKVRPSSVAIPGAEVRILNTDRSVRSDDEGKFEILELPSGDHVVEARLPGFVVTRQEITVLPRKVVEVVFDMEPAPVPLDEIVITPSRISLLREEPTAALNLDQNDIFTLPHLGDDIFRAFTLMPGVAGEDTSARFHVRGGRSDEVLVLLDDVELFEPYHLKDYSSSLSIVTPRALKEVNLITGGFPAEYGDRMSGVLDMSTEQVDERSYHLGLSLLTAELGTSGGFAEGRGHWLTSLRRGQLDLALDFLGQNQKPKYWDGFGKADYQLAPNHRFGVHLLHSDDSLDFFNIDPDDVENYQTSYTNSYTWMTHQFILGPNLFVDTVASFGKVERDRQGTEIETEGGDDAADTGEDPEDEGGVEPLPGFTLLDQRRLEATGLKQNWNWRASERHYLKWGFDVRRLLTDYNYSSVRVGEDGFLPGVRFEPREGTTRLAERLEGEQYSLYVSDRIRPRQDLTLELGVRYDEHTLTDDQHLSPRVNLVYATKKSSTFRLAWGYFYQSQRSYELQVEDGIRTLAAAERTEQRVIGYERQFRQDSEHPWLIRVEAYQRAIRSPRPRFENLLQPVEIYPEIESDRVLIAPQRGRSWGVELFVRHSLGTRVDWWASYTYSRTEDRFDGIWRPRRFDQPHALSVDVNVRATEHWNLNFAFRYHTGWPTTSITGGFGEDEDGETTVVPVIGPFYEERLADYHRIDVRFSREWQRARGTLGFFLEIQNLYDRRNHAGFDSELEFELRDDGTIDVLADREYWTRFLPSFGITWDF